MDVGQVFSPTASKYPSFPPQSHGRPLVVGASEEEGLKCLSVRVQNKLCFRINKSL